MSGFLDLFRSKRGGSDSGAKGRKKGGKGLELGAGGAMPCERDAQHLNWVMANKAVEVSMSSPNPELWSGGRMSFPAERFAAFGFEKLRDTVANYAAEQVRAATGEMVKFAGLITERRDDLRQIDERIDSTSSHLATKLDEVRRDEIELKRYYRLRDQNSSYLKYLVAFFFVITEFVISAQVFIKVFPNLLSGLEWILSLGVTLALIVIPHYTALGLKEGMTRHHQPEKDLHERAGRRVPLRVLRSLSFEEMDDRIFRIASMIVGLLLVIMVVPLSYLRATAEVAPDAPFPVFPFLFLMFLQFALSGYFFLREWLNHGPTSEAVHFVEKELTALLKQRTETYGALQRCLVAYHSASEQLVFTVQQAPRWDSYLVSAYLESIWSFRSIVTQHNPELAVFIHGAAIPTLAGISFTESAHGLVGVSVTTEHPVLGENGPCGRMWWMREANAYLGTSYQDVTEFEDLALVSGNGQDPDGAAGGQAQPTGWPVLKAPDELLGEYLFRYGGFTLRYTPPEISEPTRDEDLERLERELEKQVTETNGSTSSGLSPSNGASTASIPDSPDSIS